MPSSDVILFELHLDRVRNDTDEIASLARTLATGQLFADNWDKYNLRASEASLREAADKLRFIREEIDRLDHQALDHQAALEAAE